MPSVDFPPSPETLLQGAQSQGILRDLLASELERARQLQPGGPARARALRGQGPFEAALRLGPLPVIAEFKRGSPSLGPFAADADPGAQVAAYARGGAAACSILAEPARFLGRPGDFAQARLSGLPVLYKGFVCTEAHLDEAVALGADAVLLITRLLGGYLPAFADAARARGLEPLAEVHDAEEIPHVQAAAVRMVGWNARDLADFSVRTAPAALLRQAFPAALLIRESGIRGPEDARAALAEGFDALLIGEALMRDPDPAAFLGRIGTRAVRP
jgi:indole-3-glycerol phosphate synthase